MITREIEDGDIFESECTTLVCPVNMVGAMGKGLALAFKHRYPGLYQGYRLACDTNHFGREGLYLFRSEVNVNVLCFPTKNHWRRDSEFDLIDRSLWYLARDFTKYKITSLAMPAVGCGEGNLSWDLVYDLIQPVLHGLPISVELYLPYRK